MSINKTVVAGNLTRDPELRATASGVDVMEFSVAVNDRTKNASTGEYESYPNYVKCVMYGTRAVKLSEILNKGMKVCLLGRLHQNRWEDKKSGGNRSELVVIVDDLELMQKAREQREPQEPQEDVYEDIPF